MEHAACHRTSQKVDIRHGSMPARKILSPRLLLQRYKRKAEPAAGELTTDWPRRGLALCERDEVAIEAIDVGQHQAVRRALVHFELGVRNELRSFAPGPLERR